MEKPSNQFENDEELRAGIIGLGHLSARKSYFPQLKRRLDELERLSSELRASEDRFRTIFDSINDAIFIHDINTGAILDVNKRMTEMFGYTREEAVTLSIEDISLGLPPYTQQDAVAYLKLAAQGQPQLFDWVARTKTGSTFRAEVNMRKAIINGVAYILVTVRDVTSRKQLEEQLNQARKMESIGRLAGGVAHDYNNMLAVIIGRVGLALKRLSSDDPVARNLNEVMKAAHRSADLTKQLLTFARRQETTPTVINVNDAVEKLVTMLNQLIGEAIDLEWMPSMDAWLVKIDPSQFDQIILNLVINARDAISDSGSIKVETDNACVDAEMCHSDFDCAPGNYVVISVADSGFGMDEETIKHIFEPFFTTKELGHGTGLGLATIYGIVKQHGGFINVTSELGNGSCFKIFLPQVNAEKSISATQEIPSTKGGGESILLVEDEQPVLDMVKEILENVGYHVTDCHSAKEALAYVAANSCRIDLLVTDVVMPEINGKIFYLQLRENYPKLKCLYMSGYPNNVLPRHGDEDELVNFIQKPFSSEVFLAKIREFLDSMSR